MSEVVIKGTPTLARRRWLRVLRALAWLVALPVVALLIVAVLVVLQGTYTEVRRADTVLVLPDECAPDQGEASCDTPQLDYALDLYSRDFATHIILIGQQTAASDRTYLQSKGFPDQSLIVEDQEATRPAQMRHVAQLIRERGASSLLIVGAPSGMLRALKMARDLDLSAYGVPLPGAPTFVPLDVAREAVAYWRYVLFDA